MSTTKTAYRFRYYHGVRYVAGWKPAPSTFHRCNTCGRAWDDSKPTAWTPAPSGRCPFEYMHGLQSPGKKGRAQRRAGWDAFAQARSTSGESAVRA